MRFAYPLMLWFFWLIPVLIGVYISYGIWRKKAFSIFGHTSTLRRLIPEEILTRRKLKMYISLAGIFLLWIAAIGPQLGARLVEVRRRGIDVLIAVDCSKSMLAEDVQPNRLSRAKLALSSLIQSLEGDRVGIIAFAGTAFLQCPLTLDYSAAKMFLDFLDTDLIPRPGTALGQAISVAIASFSRKERKHKVLVLITDGEDHGSEPLAMASEARREGIKILTVGIGSAAGEPIPIRDANNAVAGYKKDKTGNIIMSKLDEDTLQNIALKTDGKYFRAASGEIEIEGILDEITGMEKKELQSRLYNQYENRYQFFLLLGILLLLCELILPEMGPVFSLKAIILLCMIVSTASYSHAGIRKKVNSGNSLYQSEKYDEALEMFKDAQIDEPESPILHFNSGNAYYRSGAYEEAYKEFQKAIESKDINIQSQSYYNMGNALYRSGKLPEAILHYRKALELNEDDEDAKYNIEYVQKKLKEMADKNKQQGQQDQQQQQQQQDQQKQEQDKQDKDQGQQQQQNQQQDGDDQKKKDQEQDKKDQQQQDESQEKKKKSDMSEEDAERLLNSLDDQEKEAQKKRRMQKKRKKFACKEPSKHVLLNKRLIYCECMI